MREQIDAGAEFLKRLHRQVPVKIAYWLKESEGNKWYLYVAFEEVNLRAGRASTALKKIAGPDLDDSMVFHISADEPEAQAALEFARRYAGKLPAWFHGSVFGKRSVEGVYVYPPPPPLPAAQAVEQRRLKSAVEQVQWAEDLRLTVQEQTAVAQLVYQGVNEEQAEQIVRKKRQKQHCTSPIPAGTMVKTHLAAWWGERPEDDPNPLLLAECQDGRRGLVFLQDTEPV